MKLSEYLDSKERGAKTKLAEQVGAYTSDLSDWVNGSRPVPVHRCLAIEAATNGEVTRRDLRPDDWQKIWPELTPSAPSKAQEASPSGAKPTAQPVSKEVSHG